MEFKTGSTRCMARGKSRRGGAPSPTSPAWRSAFREGFDCLLLVHTCTHALSRLTADLGFDPPEMVFTSSFLSLENKSTGLTLRLSAADALAQVLPAGERPVQVAAAKHWQSANTTVVETALRTEEDSGTGPSHDWTFTTGYRGTLGVESSQAASGSRLDVAESADGIDYALLSDKHVPIEHYDDVDLFESELDDNGQSRFHVKVRCMPDRTYILARFWLRVDKVLLRAHETRIWCEHSRDELVREYCEKEAAWSQLKAEGHISMRDTTLAKKPDMASPLLTKSLTVKERISVKPTGCPSAAAPE